MYGPASIAMDTLHSNYVRFSVLAVSSIFFLVDPFAAIPAFLAITAGADRKRQQRMARRGALTCLIVLMTFALAGKLIFRMFGITLPAFEIAGGVILLLIGIDMIEARRSPTQESSDETAEATSKDDAGIVPLGIPMLAGPGAISSVMILVGQALKPWELAVVLGSHRTDRRAQLSDPERRQPRARHHGRVGNPHPGPYHGFAVGGPGSAILHQWSHRPGRNRQIRIAETGGAPI
jgi:multiple antibiotic resistance protein